MRVVFAGTPDFAAHHLAALLAAGTEVVGVLTQPDRPAGRGKRLQPSPVKQCALDAGLPVLQPASLRRAASREALAELAPDVMVVVAYGLILPAAVLDIPTGGCLNVHASLLPRWRGAAPIQRAIEAGDTHSGVTIMQMDEGLDTGAMLATASCTIDDATTAGSLHDRLAGLGAPLLLSVLDDLPAARRSARAQNDADATYAAKISKEEACLDWSLPAPALARRVRAFNPYPIAYTFMGGERIRIWHAHAREGNHGSAPGTLLEADNRTLEVACGSGVLVLDELQFPGGRALPAAELLNSRGTLLAPGQRFTAVAD